MPAFNSRFYYPMLRVPAAIAAGALVLVIAAQASAVDSIYKRSPNPERMVGMEKEDVRECLGNPQKAEDIGSRDVWFYEEPVEVASGAAITRETTTTDPVTMRTTTTVEKSPMASEENCVLRLQFKGDDVLDVSYFLEGQGVPGDRDARCAHVAPQCFPD